jgi:hypothetical protein
MMMHRARKGWTSTNRPNCLIGCRFPVRYFFGLQTALQGQGPSWRGRYREGHAHAGRAATHRRGASVTTLERDCPPFPDWAGRILTLGHVQWLRH